MGLFERMFDFNRDGKMSTFEKAAKATFVCSMLAGDDSEETVIRYEETDELEDSGVDTFWWDSMDDDEKRAAIEEAGLDPEDYDFW